MPERSLADQLDQAIESTLAHPGAAPAHGGKDLARLVRIASDLRDLPREQFKTRLKSDLERKASMATVADAVTAVRQTATARLRIKNAGAAVEFYKKAFEARELFRFVAHGAIAYAEIEVGNSVIGLSEAAPEYGYPGPEAYGGSPMSIHLYVDDVDAFVAQAVSAGARLVKPVSDAFYGDRVGSVADPFGYTWGVATRKEEMSLEEMHRRLEAEEKEQEGKAVSGRSPKGSHTLTPYLVAEHAAGLIDYVKQVFGAEESVRGIGSAGGIHCTVRVGDSTVMIGGGGPELSWRGHIWPTALHVYVTDTDAVFQRALDAGGVSVRPPEDQPYGERSASVQDPFGNRWYIATWKGKSYIQEGLRTVTPCLHPWRAEPVITFLKRGFGAEEIARHATPDGVIQHASIRLGDSVLEIGEAHGPYQPMPTMFYLNVPDVYAAYLRAVNAGATSIGEPADQPYGARTAAVQDVFGNQWHMAAPIRKGKT